MTRPTLSSILDAVAGLPAPERQAALDRASTWAWLAASDKGWERLLVALDGAAEWEWRRAAVRRP